MKKQNVIVLHKLYAFTSKSLSCVAWLAARNFWAMRLLCNATASLVSMLVKTEITKHHVTQTERKREVILFTGTGYMSIS